MRSLRNKFTPSTVLAGAALFVALSGTAIATVGLNSVRTQHIKDGEVRRADIRNNAVNAAKVADGSLGVSDLSAAARGALKPMWAVVTAGGGLVRGSSGVTAQYSGASFYTVTFPRDVTACAYVATIGGGSNTYGGKGEISVYSANLLPRAVTVVTHDSAGTFSDRPFHIMVTC